MIHTAGNEVIIYDDILTNYSLPRLASLSAYDTNTYVT